MSRLAVSLLQLRCGMDKAVNLRNVRQLFLSRQSGLLPLLQTYQLIKNADTSDFRPKLVVLPVRLRLL